MMRSDSTFPLLLKKIDPLTIVHHPFLNESDEIYYCLEYTNRKGFAFSGANQLVFNYKMETKHRGTSRASYKETAIKAVAEMFRSTILQTAGLKERITKSLLVPIPPSKAKNHDEYDDRNFRMLNLFMPGGNIHELILQKDSRTALDGSNARSVGNLQANYRLNIPDKNDFEEIWFFDDIIRHGTHFRAALNLLQPRYPNCRFVGFFIARSINPL